MAQRDGTVPMRLERVPTPPPFDLTGQTRRAEMPAVPPGEVEIEETAPPSAPEPPEPAARPVVKSMGKAVDKSMSTVSGGMWRGVDSLEDLPGRTPAARTGKENPDFLPLVENSKTQEEKDTRFPGLKTGGRGKIRAVIDPMTIQLGGGKTIRLAGIEVPDADPARPGDIAISAQELLKSLASGKSAALHVSRDRVRGRSNRLGQTLAQVELEGGKDAPAQWLQGALLEKGLARVRPETDSPELVKRMLDIEARARAGRVGLWALPEYAVLSHEAAAGKIGSFQIVEGVLREVSAVRGTLYLNFGDNWRTDFSGGIEPQARTALTRAGIKPLDWKGKRVRLRGFVEERNGPYIAIDFPSQIEFPEDSREPPPETASTENTTKFKPLQGLRHIAVKPAKVKNAQEEAREKENSAASETTLSPDARPYDGTDRTLSRPP